jgi:hypothetical protein
MIVAPTMAWTVLIGGSAAIARLRPQWGSAGPWAVSAIFIVAVGIVLWARWQRGAWERMDVIGRTVPHEPGGVDAGTALMDVAVGEPAVGEPRSEVVPCARSA